MSRIIAPKDEQDLAEVIASATSPMAIEGLGSKRALGQKMDELPVVSLKAFSGVHSYEPEELVIEAGAATPLDEIEKLVHSRGQRLAFEPPDYSKMLGGGRGSIGGALACNLSGPRRLTAGAARDHILGVQGVSGRGEIFKAGGRVVKNVTGYDVSKLMAGSYGTLAALTRVTFKVLPRAETEVTLLARQGDAGALMRHAMQLPYDVSCAAHVPGVGTGLRVEGIAVSVADRMESLIKALPGPFDVLQEAESAAYWKAVRDVDVLSHSTSNCLWKISVPPGDGPGLAVDLAAITDGKFILDWSGGLIWLATEVHHSNIIRSRIKSGHAMLVRAPEAVRREVEVFHPQPAALAALSLRVKHAFDPNGLLNPGRMRMGG